jgi:hypothetical protein
VNELEVLGELPDPLTGELLPATPVNAAKVRQAAGLMTNDLRRIMNECDRILAAEAQRQGTKTLHLDSYDVTLTGGRSVDYDPHELMAGLMEAGCPPDRINAAVIETVEYKVDRRVIRSLAAANPEYAQAINNASKEVEKPWRAAVK